MLRRFLNTPNSIPLWLIAALLGWNILQAAYNSLIWPLINDPPVFHYIASRIFAGNVPYRDIFDMNMPFTYLLHMACIKIFGMHDAGFRYFDLLWLALTIGAMMRFCQNRSMLGGLIGGLLFAGYHFSGGAYAAGQRDYFMVLLLVLAANHAANYMTVQRMRLLVYSGMLLGLATMIKPHTVIYLGMVWLILITHPQSIFERGRITWYLVLGWAITMAMILAWLWVLGGLDAFLDIMSGLAMSDYARLNRISLAGFPFFALVIALLAATVMSAGNKTESPYYVRTQLLVGGMFYGFLQYYLQQRGWGYQLYPFWGFLFLAIGYNLPALSVRPILSRFCAYAALIVLCYAYSPLHFFAPNSFYNYLNLRDYMTAMDEGVKQARAKIPATIAESEQAKQYPVHFIDFTESHLWSMAMHFGWVPASRHIYPFPLILDQNVPFVGKIHTEFMTDLRDHLPQVLIISRQTSPYRYQFLFEIMEKDKEFSGFLRQHYQLVVEKPSYRIYARKS